jgi:sulfoxide reductase catalytic subunit YedY
MLVRNASGVRSSDITPPRIWFGRREFMKTAVSGAAGALMAGVFHDEVAAAAGAKLAISKRIVTTTETMTPFGVVTSYNNYYEFGSNKNQPAKTSGRFKPKPWSVAIEGECAKPGRYTLEDILKPHPLEERIYRHRCVEGWSMVVPWVGFPLGDLLKRFQPTGNAKYVEFTTIERPSEMPEQNRWFYSILPWPYVEGLRLDEAMHPLALMAVGLYGQELPNQNGAPLRLILPWKYGFKGIKAIVKIRFMDKQPLPTWQRQEPQFYGFYSNVNPGRTRSTYRNQSTETRLTGDSLLESPVIRTQMFNGYADQVASLYAGMDLSALY